MPPLLFYDFDDAMRLPLFRHADDFFFDYASMPLRHDVSLRHATPPLMPPPYAAVYACRRFSPRFTITPLLRECGRPRFIARATYSRYALKRIMRR